MKVISLNHIGLLKRLFTNEKFNRMKSFELALLVQKLFPEYRENGLRKLELLEHDCAEIFFSE